MAQRVVEFAVGQQSGVGGRVGSTELAVSGAGRNQARDRHHSFHPPSSSSLSRPKKHNALKNNTINREIVWLNQRSSGEPRFRVLCLVYAGRCRCDWLAPCLRKSVDTASGRNRPSHEYQVSHDRRPPIARLRRLLCDLRQSNVPVFDAHSLRIP